MERARIQAVLHVCRVAIATITEATMALGSAVFCGALLPTTQVHGVETLSMIGPISLVHGMEKTLGAPSAASRTPNNLLS